MDEKADFLNALEKNIASVNPQVTEQEKQQKDNPVSTIVSTEARDTIKETAITEQVLAKDTIQNVWYSKWFGYILGKMDSFVAEIALFFTMLCISVLAVVKTVYYERKMYSMFALLVQSLIIVIFFLSLNPELIEEDKSQQT